MRFDGHHRQTPKEATLEELMSAYQEADPAGTAELIDRVSPQLYRYFCSQLGNRAEAGDMLQETWLRIHRVRHTYRPGAPVLAWVYSIARRVRVDSYRTRRRRSREVGMQVLPEVGQPRVSDSRPSFREMMAWLPESQRSVVTALKVDGFSVEEIARATSTTAGAVKQKAHRAYQTLRRLVQTEAPRRFGNESGES